MPGYSDIVSGAVTSKNIISLALDLTDPKLTGPKVDFLTFNYNGRGVLEDADNLLDESANGRSIPRKKH